MAEWNFTANDLQFVKIGNDQEKIVNYIADRYAKYIDKEEARELAGKLMKEHYSARDILNGKADEMISSYIRYTNMVKESVAKANEKKAKIELSPKAKKMLSKTFALLTSAVVAVVGYAGISRIAKEIDQIQDHEIATEYFREYDAPSEGLKLPSQSYDHDNIAVRIVNVAKQNPNQFNFALLNQYFEMNYNRLYNIEIIFSDVKYHLAQDESMQTIYQEIKDINFLEYMVKSGCVSLTPEVLEALSEYRMARSQSDYAFDTMAAKHQEVIKEIIANLENHYNLQTDNLADALEDTEGKARR